MGRRAAAMTSERRGASSPPASRRWTPSSSRASSSIIRRWTSSSAIRRGASSSITTSSITRRRASTSTTVRRRATTITTTTTSRRAIGTLTSAMSHLRTDVTFTTIDRTVAITSPVTILITVEALHITVSSSGTTSSSSLVVACKLNTNFTPINCVVVQITDSILSIHFIFHFDKSKSRRISGSPGGNNSPKAGESIFDGSNFYIRIQVSNVNLHWSTRFTTHFLSFLKTTKVQ
mmetsp:Transcript_37595/g.59335  ORF Transcript_37595/g.59335 Transcript_37595/m.59335 type:complete len:234 (+) Transcript_37595:371-1072(+)